MQIRGITSVNVDADSKTDSFENINNNYAKVNNFSTQQKRNAFNLYFKI